MFETEFAKIRKRVEELNQKYPHCHYLFSSPIEQAKVEIFERRYPIRLPEEYRAFVMCVGDRLYDAEDPQFDLLLQVGWEAETHYLTVSCPAFWHEKRSHHRPRIYRWFELTGHEKIESHLALLIHEDWSHIHYLLLLTGPNAGQVLYCSAEEPETKPMLSQTGEPMRFLQWMMHLLKAN